MDDGRWLAMGAVAAVAAAGLVRRRGSLALEPIGYHCTRREITGQYAGWIRPVYRERFSELFGALPYAMQETLYERYGLDPMVMPDQYEEGHDEWVERFVEAMAELGVEWIFVSEVPLSDYGSHGRSAYGRWCYRVSIPSSAVLGWLEDHDVATGNRFAQAYVVIYDANRGRPVLEEIEAEAEHQVQMINLSQLQYNARRSLRDLRRGGGNMHDARAALDSLRRAIGELDVIFGSMDEHALERMGPTLRQQVIDALEELDDYLVDARAKTSQPTEVRFGRYADALLEEGMTVAYLYGGTSRIRLLVPCLYDDAESVSLTSSSSQGVREKWTALGGAIW